jgi:hypothetical protein
VLSSIGNILIDVCTRRRSWHCRALTTRAECLIESISARPTEPTRIAETNRIGTNITVRIDTASEPDQIRLKVPPRLRIIISEVVVEEPRLGQAIRFYE